MPSKTPQLIRITAELKARRGPCWICGMSINYALPWDDEMAFSLEHIHPRSTHPELENDPGNCVASHSRCNKRRGNRAYAPSLGQSSEDF